MTFPYSNSKASKEIAEHGAVMEKPSTRTVKTGPTALQLQKLL